MSELMPGLVQARRRASPSVGAASSSTFGNFLRTVTPVVLAHGNNVLPSTDTWFEVGDASTQSDDKLAKSASKKRKRLGHIKRKRDRIQQEILHASRIDRNLQSQLTASNKRISQLQGAEAVLPSVKEVCICVLFLFHVFNFVQVTSQCDLYLQVYDVLKNNYADCPWPVPPSAILMHLPIKEQRQKGMTSEAILRQIVSRDRKYRHCANWLIRDVHVRPDKTFWDDGTDARVAPQRHYAFRIDHKTVVSENRWVTFLNHWSKADLACATNLVCAHVYSDLSSKELDLLRTLRVFHDVLLLKKDDPLHAYQLRLKSLHRMGIVNLSLARADASLSKLLARKRSLEASLRESRKRTKRAQETIDRMRTDYNLLETKLDDNNRLLAEAERKLLKFRNSHPNWNPADPETLTDEDHDQAAKIFDVVDKDLDVQLQLKYDPSGGLACFWAEQRKILSSSPKGRRWNPRVRLSNSCLFILIFNTCFFGCCRCCATVFFCGWRWAIQNLTSCVT